MSSRTKRASFIASSWLGRGTRKRKSCACAQGRAEFAATAPRLSDDVPIQVVCHRARPCARGLWGRKARVSGLKRAGFAEQPFIHETFLVGETLFRECVAAVGGSFDLSRP